ncbi:DUF2325 domain-containing protein [Burkholderia cenocepacia]|uniref:DUF2325 domain-containing protein n=1 Tax=Burkholderia cenocepacia TaxID=95486 RepID=UPI002237E475|nr:DUF2325 domain-containing protein [Burkholderia cenocepacia]MCW5116329.1 DUF2325 domain-containing protein [Burkholderia cenocepacia]MCW5129928.1 DUF2325 domain-containing protein [Burkholderia cenocepacia]MCW5173631.1 DUF2325 domain-containing protein [Burkholderia cenocepacia]
MHAPPFRLARTADLSSPGGHSPAAAGTRIDACCAPSRAQQVELTRRARLSELDANLHCSIIGTCLTTHELRKLVPKFADVDRQRATDLEIHHAAVELAIGGTAGAKALHKALDERYAGAIRAFDGAKDADALVARWKDALASGDIPQAYWALMTHPRATMAVRQVAFGDVHMLSHLVGAANRADIRRLVALERENAELHAKLERQQARLHEMSTQRDAALQERDALHAHRHAPPLAAESVLRDEVHALREALAARDERLALHTSRREAAEQRIAAEQASARAMRARLDDLMAMVKTLRAEASALEQAVQASTDDPAEHAAHSPSILRGTRVVYVGGRPGSNRVIRRIVETAGGEVTLHDGGIEDRKGLLAAALPGARMVVFPVDCIDHDSMNLLKRTCERHHIAYYPLRTASVASFVELIGRLDAQARDVIMPNAAASDTSSRFCLRHG